MTKNITFNLDSIDASRWLRNEVQAKHKQLCIDSINKVFHEFEGQKSTKETLRKFIKALHEEIKKEIQS
jgi:hypothetical protein